MKSSLEFEIRCLVKCRLANCLTLGLICQLLCFPLLWAQLPEPGSNGDFVLTRDWSLELDGHPVAGSTVHYSRYQVAWLVDGAVIEPMLIDLRTRSVSRLSAAAAAGLEDSLSRPAFQVAVGPEDVGNQLAELSKDGDGYLFKLGEQRFRLAPAPPVLGRQTLAVVEARHPRLAAERAAYATLRSEALVGLPVPKQADQTVDDQAEDEDVVVRVYFGSWSSASLRLIPRIAAVDEAWTGGSVRFEYYGLPQPLIDDAQAAFDAVVGVPTVVVKRGDRELGRMTGRTLAEPAAALAEILSSRAN